MCKAGATFSLEKEHARTITALERARIVHPLPRSGMPGVIGIDGKEYPAPTREQLRELLARNERLVDRKMRQGFTQLQLTPMAMPAPQLIERVMSKLLEHAAAGKLSQTKRDPAEVDTPVRVNTRGPLWIWEKVRRTLDAPDLVYFPRSYDSDHQGLTKEEVIRDPSYCAVPGWSVGLVEPIPIMPQPGQGKVIDGRGQLEACHAPNEFLRTLGTPEYDGETGWALEDFLTHFVTRLEMTCQVSHDRYDGNALWLLGTYLPYVGPGLGSLVPVGYWARKSGRMEVSAHRSANRLKGWVARSMARFIA